jgi:opacity protein-like surface antigen
MRLIAIARGALLTAALPAAEAAAQQPAPAMRSPWYLTLSAGALLAQDAKFTTTVQGLGVDASASWKTGFGFLGGAGYRLFDWLAVEAELGVIRVSVDKGSARLSNGFIFPSQPVDATLSGFAFFANGVGQWRLTERLVPYAGAGLGFVRYASEDVAAAGTFLTSVPSATQFAFQIKAGLGVELGPNLTLAPEYRFLWIDKSSNGLGSTKLHWLGANLRFNF